MNTLQYSPEPDELWLPGKELSQPVLDTLEEYKYKSFEEIAASFPEIYKSVYGLEYSVFTNEGFSTEEAIVFFCPFNNSIEDYEQMKAEFIWKSAMKSGVHDEKGNPLPLVLMGAPGIGVNVEFRDEKHESDFKRKVTKGDFSPMAELYMDSFRDLGFMVAHPQGFSQGADIAVDSIKAGYNYGLDTPTVAAADPVTAKSTSKFPIVRVTRKGAQFASEAKYLDEAINQSGATVFSDAHERNQDYTSGRSRFVDENLSMIKAVNIQLARGFARGTLDNRIKASLAYRPNLFGTVAVSEAQLVNGAEAIEITNRHSGYKSILLKGENHAWGEKIPLLTMAILDPLIRER